MSFDYISTVKTAFGYSSVIGMVKHNTDLIHSVVDLFDHKIQWKFFRASEHGSERALGFRDKQCCIMIHISNSLLTHQRSEFIEVLSGKCLDTQLGDLFLLNLSADRESDRSENELRFGKEATNNKIDKRVVCVCMNVCVDDIENAIESGCTKMSELSRKTKAGTNCGSCLPEVKMILSQSLKVINCT